MKKILIVDDEPDQVYTVKTALESSEDNFSVLGANGGKECFQLLKEHTPDLIILDIMMPEMSGWEVYDKIKDNPAWKNIPIVFLTARTDRVAENAGQFLGEDFLEKPIEMDQLKIRINRVFEKRD